MAKIEQREYVSEPINKHIILEYKAKDKNGNQIDDKIEGVGSLVIDAIYDAIDKIKGKELSSIQIINGYHKKTSEKISSIQMQDVKRIVRCF